MPSWLDVRGTITQKLTLIIIAIVAAGLVLVFTPLNVMGYLLLAIAAIIYVFASFRTLVHTLR